MVGETKGHERQVNFLFVKTSACSIMQTRCEQARVGQQGKGTEWSRPRPDGLVD